MANQRSTITVLTVFCAGLALTGCAVQVPPELAEAVSSGNIKKVQSILKENSKLINSKFKPHGNTLLHRAVRGGNKELVELLVANGAEMNPKNKSGYTPLSYIGWPTHYQTENHREIAKFLIANGADVRGCKGFLHRMLIVGWHDVAILAIDNGIDVNIKDQDGYTPLHFANNIEDNIEFTKLLIAMGANVNAKNKDGITPLHEVVRTRNGRKDIVELLIANGADVKSKDKKGQTPLSWAVKYGNDETAELLRKHGAVK